MTKNHPQAVLKHSEPEIKSTLTIDIPRDYVAEVFIPGDSGDEDYVPPSIVAVQDRDGRHVIRVVDESEEAALDTALEDDDSIPDVGVLATARSTYPKIVSWLAENADAVIEECDSHRRSWLRHGYPDPWILSVGDGPKENRTYEQLRQLMDMVDEAGAGGNNFTIDQTQVMLELAEDSPA